MNKLSSLFLSLVMLMGMSMTAKSQSDADNYWILEEFSQFESIADTLWIMDNRSYPLYPNQVILNTNYSNFEEPSGCSKGRASLRIRGLKDDGYAEFTVPNASTVTFSITGKRIEKDRSVRIQRNGTVVFTHSNFDRNDCITFTDSVNSQTSLTYKITTNDPDNNDPIALLGIEAVKYGVSIEPEPEPELNNYWIYDDLDTHGVEEDYNIGAMSYYSIPNQIELSTQNCNIEYGQDCTQGSKNLRISGRQGAAGSLTFTVPNAKTTRIGVSGKSTSKDRTILIYKNGGSQPVATIGNLDRTVCQEWTEEANSSEPVTYTLVGASDGLYKPVVVDYIQISKYNPSEMSEVQDDSFNFYPNPAKDVINFPTPVEKVSILDMNGRLLISSSEVSELYISSLNKGFYIIKITTETGTLSRKLIKE